MARHRGRRIRQLSPSWDQESKREQTRWGLDLSPLLRVHLLPFFEIECPQFFLWVVEHEAPFVVARRTMQEIPVAVEQPGRTRKRLRFLRQPGDQCRAQVIEDQDASFRPPPARVAVKNWGGKADDRFDRLLDLVV